MNKKIFFVFAGILFLIFAFFIGPPLEISNLLLNRIATTLLCFAIVLLFFKLFKFAHIIEKKCIKYLSLVFLLILAIPYFLVGIWTLGVISNPHAKWEDMTIYTNQKGEKIIYEWRETSGSIYYYRSRKIIKDFGNGVRFSFDYNEKNMEGIWTTHDLRNDSTYSVNFDKK